MTSPPTLPPPATTDETVVHLGMADENRLLAMRLSCALAYAQMLHLAYDALMNHGINYKDLASYKDSRALDEANKLPLAYGRTMIIDWLGRMEADIIAAVRRKSFRPVK